jgi:hypothetical protein
MKTVLAEKPRIVQITDSDEIASIQRGGRFEIIGDQDQNGGWWAYSWSVDRWRRRQTIRKIKEAQAGPDADAPSEPDAFLQWLNS